MAKSQKVLVACVIFIVLACLAYAEQLKITKLDRNINLSVQYPVEQSAVFFKSEGSVNVFKHAVPLHLEQQISKIVFSRTKQTKEQLHYTKQQYLYNGQKYVLYKVQLDREYYNDEDGQIYITTEYLFRYVNFPQQITMSEDQKFELQDNKYFISPYPIQSQTNTYKFDKILNHDKDGELKGINTVVFRKENSQPFEIVSHIIHGVNNDPQVYFTNVQRVIEVSHWGNIAITEFYKLKNYGPSLKGQFSRIAFGTQQNSNVRNAFRGIEATLPYEAWGLYYRDQVGNISTSKAYRDQNHRNVKVGLVPRFALLGGWKANWEIGYNLPTKPFLYHQGNKFQLDKIELQYTLEKVVTEHYDLKIILPEGVKNVHFKINGVELIPTKVDKNFGFLDFLGRPTFIFQDYEGTLKKKKITVDYELGTLSTLHKPIILFGAIFTLLATLIIVKRLKFEAFKEEKTL